MLYPDIQDVPVEVFGGWTPAIPPSDLPPGAASVAQDVEFPMGTVRSRGGLLNYFSQNSPIPANASINGLKSFVTPALAQRLLVWDSLGNFYKEKPQGTLNLVASRPYAGLFYQSTTLFGREYQAFFNSLGGFDIPRQYDDQFWDRVSQVGPGAGPNGTLKIADVSYPLTAVSRAVTTGVLTGTISTTTSGITVGGFVTVAGVVGDATLNGQWIVATVSVGGGSTTFTAWTLAGQFAITSISRSGGTVTAMLGATPTFSVGATIVIGQVNDASYDGSFTVATISGNTVTWAQAGTNSASFGGFLYIQQVTVPVILCAGIFNSSSANVFLTGDATKIFTAGGQVTIAGNSVAGWNTTFPVQSVTLLVSPNQYAGNTLIVVGVTGLFPANGFGGTATPTALPASNPAVTGVAGPTGNISPGNHQLSVSFITRQGFITPPSPPIRWYAQGGFKALITGIPLGPANVNARLVLFTPFIPAPAMTSSFYSLPSGVSQIPSSSMFIGDNTTTSLTVDFSDAALISGFAANYLFTQLELGESSFVIGYNSRLFWLGERAKVNNLLNLTFEGGWNLGGGTAGSDLPLGWTSDPANGGGAVRAQNLGDYEDGYRINGDGATLTRGMISQPAFQDYLLVPIIQPNTAYGIRCRAYAVFGTISGTLEIDLFSPTQGTLVALRVGAFRGLTTIIQEFTSAAGFTGSVIPSDLVLRVYATDTVNNGGAIVVDSIEVFPAGPLIVMDQPQFNYSTARASHAFNPESYDATTGQIQIRPGDGRQLRAGFTLRNNLYFGKDNYLCYVTDDGVNEPASWPVQEVSSTIGICGPNAVDSNEEWAVFAHRTGGYITWGGDPVKITPEIQEDASNTGQITWNSINWAAAYTIWVRIDRTNKMILFGVPVNGATTPNYVFMLDYKWLESPQEIAGTPLVTYSAFTGKMLAHGRGRRWSGWNITANCMTFAERTDGTEQPFFGSGFTNGKVYQQVPVPAQASDDGAPIDSRYRTYGAPSPMEEQMLRFSSHRKLLGYLKFRAIGAGSLLLTVISANRTTTLRSYTLSNNPAGDGERPVNIHGERFYVEVSTNAVGQWFQLERLIPCLKKDAAIPVRGVSV